jgi:hypothetical protein
MRRRIRTAFNLEPTTAMFIHSLTATALPLDREVEAATLKVRSAEKRFAVRRRE